MKAVVIHLQGTLMSFGGEEDGYYERQTADYPHRSAVLGLLLNAMRCWDEEDQEKFLGDVKECRMEAACYNRETRSGIPAKRYVDYQIVGADYGNNMIRNALYVPRRMDGNKPSGGTIRITRRHYLQDKMMRVAFEVPDEYLEEVEHALMCPKGNVFLGRKCCSFTADLYGGTYGSFEEASEVLNDQMFGWKKYLCVIEGYHPESGFPQPVRDVPIKFGIERDYEFRYITLIYTT